jgi:flagellar hook-basal body complex protein FliE
MDPLSSIAAPRPITPIAPIAVPGAPVDPAAGFATILKEALGHVQKTQDEAAAATTDFATGKTTDVAGTMIAVERANITLQLMLQIRTELLQAYQEIQRMQA